MKLPEPKTPIFYPTTLEELEAMRNYFHKEIRPQMLAIHAQNPGVLHNSPSRSVMMTQHIPQHLVVFGSEPPLILTGLEYELGKYTFATRMPHNGTIERIIPRYGRGISEDDINQTPELTVIYRKEANGEFAVLNITEFRKFHPYFGFKNKMTPAVDSLYVGARFAKGTKFADTPANTEDELYTYGVNFATAPMDIPGVAEDGKIISRSALNRLAISVFEEREISFGRDEVPLNLLGDFNNQEDYKIMPDIGEEIRADGLLMALRRRQEFMNAALLNDRDLRRIDHIFDRKLYSRETSRGKDILTPLPGGIVRDIQVIKSFDGPNWLPPTMTKQLDKYATALQKYNKELLNFEQEKTAQLRRMDRNAKLRIDPHLSGMLVRARALSGQTGSRLQGTVGFQYRHNKLDEYTVKFVIEHKMIPNIGWKLTGIHGDKGVIVQIWEDEWMPVDKDGNRAEIIVSSNSTIARSNWGRGFIPYFSASARDLRKMLIKMSGLNPNKITEEAVELMDENLFNQLFRKLLEFYAIVSPKQYWFYAHHIKTKEERVHHLYNCLKDAIRPFMPVDNPINDIDAVLHLEKHFPQTYGPVKYRGVGGEWVETKDKVRIAPMYFMLLEKIADDGSSASIGKLQHHGLLASQTKTEKYAQNYRPSHTRNFGEAESRLGVFYAKTVEAMAEIHDRSNNPETMRAIGELLLTHPTPTNIDVAVDRTKIELGNSRPLQYLQNFMLTQGAQIAYMSEREAFELGMREKFDVK